MGHEVLREVRGGKPRKSKGAYLPVWPFIVGLSQEEFPLGPEQRLVHLVVEQLHLVVWHPVLAVVGVVGASERDHVEQAAALLGIEPEEPGGLHPLTGVGFCPGLTSINVRSGSGFVLRGAVNGSIAITAGGADRTSLGYGVCASTCRPRGRCASIC